MKKMKGFLSVLILALIIAPFTFVNAQDPEPDVGTVDVDVFQPIAGMTAGNNADDYVSVSSTTDYIDHVSARWVVGPNQDASFTGEFVAGTAYYLEINIDAEFGHYFNLQANPIVNLAGETAVIKHTGRSTATALCLFVEVKAVEEEEPEDDTIYYQVAFCSGNDTCSTIDVEAGTKIPEEEIFEPVDMYGGLIFDGWYIDKALTTKFDFSKPINKNTLIYSKWKSNEEYENIIKEKLDAAKLTATSNLTEKEYMDLLLKGDEASVELAFNSVVLNGTIPENFGDKITILSHGQYYWGEHEYTIWFNYNNPNFYYNYIVPVTFKDTGKHDATLDKVVDDISSQSVYNPYYVDYTKIDSVTTISQEEFKKELDARIKSIDGISNFELTSVEVNYGGDDYSETFIMSNNDLYYGLHSGYLYLAYKIDVASDVENNRKAYIASVKSEVIKYFKSLGYDEEDIIIDEDYYNEYYMLDVEYGEYSVSIYMIKDTENLLVGKNIFTKQAGDIFRIRSLSEDEEDIKENNPCSYEFLMDLKSDLVGDGYELFEGYIIDGYATEKNPVNLTFVVGTENNNRKFRVLHKKADGSVEKYEGIVKDGEFTIAVTEFSPFAVGLGEVVKTLKNNPQTFDPIIFAVIMLLVSTVGASLAFKLLKD